MKTTSKRSSALLLSLSLSLVAVNAQVVAPFYAGAYTVRDVGSAPNVPGRYGGLAFKSGSTNSLLIGGDGNTHDAKIYQVTVVRGAGNHISGFTGSATFVAPAYGPDSGGIDGGLAYGPGGVLFYTTYDDNSLGQIKPGSSVVDKLTPLNPGALTTRPWSVGSLVFVPSGLPGAGRLKILDYSSVAGGGAWWDTTLTADGSGTFNLGAFSAPIQLVDVGCEGAFYVAAGNPRFTNHSVLICDYGSSSVVSYEVDGNGDPKPATKRLFLTELTSPEGGTVDPVTGDFVFSSFDGVHLYIVSGFTGGVAPPVVAITAPANGARMAAPASFEVVAAASQTNGSISQVQLYMNGVGEGSLTQPPYAWSFDGLPVGSYTFSAVAVGNGMSTTSAPVVITVTNPPSPLLSVAITEPANQAEVCDCSWIPISVEATVSSGSMPTVTVYNHGTNVLGTFTKPPYLLNLVTFGFATNVLSAVASDGLGHSITSALVTVRVVGLVKTNQLAVMDTGTNAVRLCFRGQVSSNYVFEYSTNLLPGATVWVPFRTNVAPANTSGELSIVDTNILPLPRRFYRTRRQ